MQPLYLALWALALPGHLRRKLDAAHVAALNGWQALTVEARGALRAWLLRRAMMGETCCPQCDICLVCVGDGCKHCESAPDCIWCRTQPNDPGPGCPCVAGDMPIAAAGVEGAVS